MCREKLLKYCAWALHLYTACGAVTAILALNLTAHGHFHDALIVMAIALFIDSTDGPIARFLNVRAQAPFFDGSLLDNIVDYLTYVAVPVFFMLRVGTLADDIAGLAIGSFIMVASAYAFCRTDAKTPDYYFRGFPSYWNLVAFYLFCLQLPVVANSGLLIVLATMEFLPVKFVYPNRTKPLRRLTLTLASIWAVVTALMLPAAPSYNPALLCVSLAFIVYYFGLSLTINFYPNRFAIAESGAPAPHSA